MVPLLMFRKILLLLTFLSIGLPTFAQQVFNKNQLPPTTVYTDSANTSFSNNVSFAGPRPEIDVTAAPYNAQGTGPTHDDTASIQAAINAACAATVNGLHVYPIIVFPPGYYAVFQPQLPSTAPVFELPCTNLTFRGMGTSEPTATARVPQVIIQSQPGIAPNAAPIFDCKFTLGCSQNITFQDLQIAGYNKALWVYTANNVKLENTTLSVQNTGMADNSALMLTNVLDFEWNAGTCEGIEAANKYCILLTGDTILAGEAPLDAYIYIHNLTGVGGMIRYDQRVNSSASGPGNWSFDNIRGWEANYGPFISITNSTGNPDSVGLASVNNITMSNVTAADSAGQFPLINFPLTHSTLSGIIIDNSLGGTGGSPAIVLSGTTPQLVGCNIRASGLTSYTAWEVVDGNGNPVAGCSVSNLYGMDFLAQNTGSFLNNLRSDIFPQGAAQGPPVRVTLSGNRFAGVALDPTFGLMLNDGTDFGFGAGITESVAGTLDLEFAKNYPPTALTGTPATGGSIPAGTYYGTVYSSTSGGTCNGAQSAPSQQSASVVLSGSNNAITWNWTPPTAGTNLVAGYCIAIATVPNLNAGGWMPVQSNWQFVTGGSTTSLSMLVLPSTGGPLPLTSTLIAVHRWTPNALGIDTLSPNPNSLTINGGFGCAYVTKSANYSLTSGDCWVSVTGNTTITAPHAVTKAQWTVFNNGSGSVSLQADSGTMNLASSIILAPQTGADVVCDGTNCSANTGGNSSGGFTAGGDLTGTSTNQNVAKLQGSTLTVTAGLAGSVFFMNGSGTIVNGLQGVKVNPQTGNYTFSCASDRYAEISFAISTPSTFTLPQPGTSTCLQSNPGFVVRNASQSCCVLTVLATSSVFLPENVATKPLLPGESAFVYSDAVSSAGNYNAVVIHAAEGGIVPSTTTGCGNYNAQASDNGKLIVFNCSTGTPTYVMPNPQFTNSSWHVKVISVGSVLATINLNSMTFNGSGTSPVLASKVEQDFYIDTVTTTNYLGSTNTPYFSNLLSGTNTGAAMLVGTGASLGVTGTGTIDATSIHGNTYPANTAFVSGGIMCFTSTSIATSSTLLAAGGVLLGGGPGICPNTDAGITYSTAGGFDTVSFGVSGTSAGSLLLVGNSGHGGNLQILSGSGGGVFVSVSSSMSLNTNFILPTTQGVAGNALELADSSGTLTYVTPVNSLTCDNVIYTNTGCNGSSGPITLTPKTTTAAHSVYGNSASGTGTAGFTNTPSINSLALFSTGTGSCTLNMASSGGVLQLCSTNTTTDGNGNFTAKTLNTIGNCSSSASPAVCGSSAAGSVVIAVAASTVTVNTSAVDANSQIFVFPDETLGTKLGVTCNSTLATAASGLAVTARVANTSFTISTLATVASNPVCLSYVVIN